jgi:hypothetical protein
MQIYIIYLLQFSWLKMGACISGTSNRNRSNQSLENSPSTKYRDHEKRTVNNLKQYAGN